ncbi:MAG TPA: BlaI/MecI/CopY family transcriptional regulator [Pyrinomonadaceae bacterium]|nr:BlaI/MecI/CopY family transcriptional regulator [Pyrinomonadaceae bacterium]
MRPTTTRVGDTRTMKMGPKQKLGDRELDMMQVLWETGGATVAEVHQSLLSRRVDVAYTTVQTMLNRLEGKGLVKRDDSDRAHRYLPVLKEPAVVNGAIQKLAERFFSGSVEALATRLVEKDLSLEQLEKLQEFIDAHRQKGLSK